jgi:predicted RNase H-like nuclease (RuvC/YqgF family)
MILDYEFVRLYKILEGSITRMLTTRTNDEQTKPSDQSSIILAQYTDVIQQQNQQINAYQQQEKQFLDERNFYQKKTLELEQSLQEIRDQYASLKSSFEQGKF